MTNSSEIKKKRGCIGCFVKAVLLFTVGSLAVALVVGVAVYWSYNRDLYPGMGSQTKPLIIRGGTVFDGVDGSFREAGLIVVEDGRITCLGADCAVPAGSEEIDGTELAILPGLIDAHVHFGAPSAESRSLSMPAQLWDYARQRPDVRRNLLEAGVTTIRSVGDVDTGIIQAREGVASGELAGPRIYTTGPLITAWGGHPAGTHYKGNPWLVEHGTRQVGDAAAAREAVRELAQLGVDGIKVVYGGAPHVPRLGRETLEATIDEGHKQGRWVTAHTTTPEELAAAVEAGADALEHGVTSEAVSDESITLMRDRDTTYVPTLAVMAAHPEALAMIEANLARVHAGGVRIAAGTDTQGPGMAFGTSLHRELALMVGAGMSPTEALLAATRNGAQLLGAAEDLGTVEVGKVADILLVAGQPWEHIDDIGQIRYVFQEGVAVYRAPDGDGAD